MSTETTLTIVGNLTADPEIGFTRDGSQYARFSIAATPRRYNRDTGQWVDGDTLFMRCVAWRDVADHVAESLGKGTRVIATGTLRQSSWETTEGDKRTAIDLHVEEIGPSLRFATATVVKAPRSGQPDPVDPWAAPPSSDRQPATATTGTDTPPF